MAFDGANSSRGSCWQRLLVAWLAITFLASAVMGVISLPSSPWTAVPWLMTRAYLRAFGLGHRWTMYTEDRLVVRRDLRITAVDPIGAARDVTDTFVEHGKAYENFFDDRMRNAHSELATGRYSDVLAAYAGALWSRLGFEANRITFEGVEVDLLKDPTDPQRLRVTRLASFERRDLER